MHCGKGTTGHQREDGLAMPSTCKWHDGSCFYHDAQHKWYINDYAQHNLLQKQTASSRIPRTAATKILINEGLIALWGRGRIWRQLQKGPQGICEKLTTDLQSAMSVSPMPWQQTPFKDTMVFLPTELSTFLRAVRAFQPQLVWSFFNSYNNLTGFSPLHISAMRNVDRQHLEILFL